MKTVRISLAVAAGALLGLGYMACSDHDQLSSKRIVIGLLFGAVSAGNMILRKERISPKLIHYFVVPLLLALMVHEVRTGTLAEAVVTIGVSIAFVGVQLAFASLPMDPSMDPTEGRKSSVPPEEF